MDIGIDECMTPLTHSESNRAWWKENGKKRTVFTMKTVPTKNRGNSECDVMSVCSIIIIGLLWSSNSKIMFFLFAISHVDLFDITKHSIRSREDQCAQSE
jgi:hypothetical protein